MHELDRELRSVLTTREVEVLSRALPRITAYFADDEREVASARAI